MPTFAQQIAVEETSPDTFISQINPQRMGNGAPIAYGGCTASLAVHSACKTVPANFHVYTVLGAFHGPTRTDRKVLCRVTQTRDTKTFISRRVVAFQTTDAGTERPCMELTVEFHVTEPALYDFSAAPTRPEYLAHGPLDPQHTITFDALRDRLVESGDLTSAAAAAHKQTFAQGEEYFVHRSCTSSLGGQNLSGFAKQLRTTQEHLPMTEKSSAEWTQLRQPLGSEAENVAAVAFFMDGGLSFLPLVSDHKLFEDAGACSSLDFALRILRPGVDLHQWHLRERTLVGAAMGRTYAEGRLWDEQGRLVALETQTCIVRPLPEKRSEPNNLKARI